MVLKESDKNEESGRATFRALGWIVNFARFAGTLRHGLPAAGREGEGGGRGVFRAAEGLDSYNIERWRLSEPRGRGRPALAERFGAGRSGIVFALNQGCFRVFVRT